MEPVSAPQNAANAPSPDDIEQARKAVRRLRDFYQLLATAVIVVAISAIVNLATGGRLWFPWVIFGFGTAIAFSAFDTFGRNLWLGRDWQERKMREMLERNRGA